MKVKLANILAAVALMATGAASIGCVWFMADEPQCSNLFED